MKIDVEIAGEILQWKEVPGFKDGTYTIEIKNMDSQTRQQQRSLYLWMKMISNTLNRENIPTTQLLKAEIHWTPEKVKYMLIQPLLEALFGMKSTTKVPKHDFDVLIDTLTKVLGERGIQAPAFPSIKGKEEHEYRQHKAIQKKTAVFNKF